MSKAKGSSAKRQSETVWATTGWQGVTADIPDSWNMAAYGGEARSGNVRWDNSDASRDSIVGLEVRWNQTSKPLTEADLEKRIDQYFEGVIKDAKKRKITTETKSTPIEDADHPERTSSRSFVFRTDRKGVGRIWYCSKCKRTVIAQVITGVKTDIAIPRQVIDSMRCHPVEDDWNLWSLYDLRTQAPATYSLLRKPQLMNIYVQLTFQWGRSTDEITVEQWGVANVQLRGAYLDDWFKQKSANLVPMLKYETSETTAHGHTALRITGKRTGLRYWLFEAWPQIQKLRRPSPYFEACLWECPETNKVHMIQTFTRRRRPELVDQIVERTVCHS